MAVELASAYISLSANTKSIPGDVKKALGQAEGAAVSSGSSIGSKLSSGMKKTLKAGMVTAAATGAAAFGATLSKGFQRLDAVEQAQVKFEALGYTAKEQASLMDDVTNSVIGTAFATSEAADAAAMSLAGGIEPGKELTGVLKTIGDSASFANKNFAEVAPIYTKAINQGKVMGDTLQQLSDNGLPAASALAESMGKTSEEIYEMASKGEISFNDLQKAMDGAIGGQALKAGETFQGSLANVGAAAGRLGEELLSSAFSSAPKVFGNISGQIDKLTEKVGPLAEVWSKKLSGSVSDFARKAAPHANDILGMLGDGLKQVGNLAQSAVGPLKSIGNVMGDIPFSVYTAGIANVIGQQTGLIGKLNESSGGLKGFIKNVNGTKNDLRSHGIDIGFVGAAMANLGDQYPWVERATQAFNDASLPLRNAGEAARDAGWEVGGMGNIVKQAEGTVKTFGGVAAGAAKGGLSLLASGATGLMNALGGPWGLAITGAGWLIGQLAKKHKEAAEEERKHKEMQQQLRDTLDETSGAVTRQTRELQLKSLEESGAMDSARKMGLSQDTMANAASGNADAMRLVEDATRRSTVAAIEGSDYWAEYGHLWEEQGFTVNDMADYLNGATDATDGLTDAIKNSDQKIGEGKHWRNFADEMSSTSDSARDLNEQLGNTNKALQDAQLTAATDEINALRDGAKGASDTFKILGDEMVRIGEEPGTVSVEMDAEKAFEVQKKLKDIGVDADYLDEERQLVINMNNGNAIIGMLDTIEGKVKYLPDGSVDIKNNTDYVNDQLVQMGILKDQDGELVMSDNVGDTLRRLYEYGAFKKDRNGNLVIADNIDDVLRRVEDELDGKQSSGTHTISINEIIGKTYTSSAKATARAGGGLIPALAGGGLLGGYRLPTSGPGTNTTDGILGIGPGGVPLSWLDGGEWVINAKSSKKYHDLLRAINSGDDAAIGQITGHAGGGSLGGSVGSFNMSGFSEFGNVATSIQSNVTGVIGSAMASAANMFTSFGSVVTDTAAGVVSPQFDNMAANIQAKSSSVINPSMGGVRDALTQTGAWFQNRVGTVVNPVWNAMGANVAHVRQAVTDPAMAGIRSALSATGVHFTSSVNGTINPIWSAMGNHVKAVKDGTVLPVFNAVEGGLTQLSGWFGTSVSNIGTAWDRLRAATARPAKFVVETVMNNGIRNAWNAVADLIGEDKMRPVGLGKLGAYATGGVLPGYTPGKDVHHFSSPTGGRLSLSGGEAIMRPEWTRAVGGPRAVAQMNSAARTGSLKKKRGKYATDHEHFADGGIWQSLWGAAKTAFPNATLNSSYRAGHSGYHGRGAAVDLGGPMQQIANWIYKTYPNSAQLIWGPGPLLYNAGGQKISDQSQLRNQVYAADLPGHYDHVHWASDGPITSGGKMISMAGGSAGAAMMVSMADMAKEAWDGEIKKIRSYSGPGEFGAMPNKFKKSASEKAWGYLKKQADKMEVGPDAPGGAGAERWRSMIKKAFSFQGEQGTKPRVDALVRQIWTESKGDPNIAQQIVDDNGTGESAGVGLYQVIPTTWEGFRDPRLSSNRRDPWAQHNFAVRYFRDRHNWNMGPGGVGRGHGWKSGGVLPSNLPAALFDDGGYLQDGQVGQNQSGKPEPVFTHKQWQILKGNIMSAAQAGDLKKLQANLGVVANGLRQAVAKLDWQEIFGAASKAFNDKFFEDQASDVRSVFGAPDPDSIPAVKAYAEFRENEKKLNEEQAEAAKDSREAVTRADSAADKISGAPVPVKAKSESVSVGSQVARTGALVSRALANPNPATFAAAAGSAGQVINNINVVDDSRAYAEYRKMEAKRTRGRVGAR